MKIIKYHDKEIVLNPYATKLMNNQYFDIAMGVTTNYQNIQDNTN